MFEGDKRLYVLLLILMLLPFPFYPFRVDMLCLPPLKPLFGVIRQQRIASLPPLFHGDANFRHYIIAMMKAKKASRQVAACDKRGSAACVCA